MPEHILMLQKRWTSKRDPAKRREILEFLATPEARGMSDREIARRFLVGNQFVSRLRAELRPKFGPDAGEFESHTPPPTDHPGSVCDSSPRPPRERPDGPWIREFREILEKTPAGEVPSFPEFLVRKRTPETDEACRRHVEADKRRPLVGGIAGLFAAIDERERRRALGERGEL